MKKDPCLNCPNRRVLCQPECKDPDYLAWRKAKDDRKKRIVDAMAKQNLLDGYQRAAADKARRRKWN